LMRMWLGHSYYDPGDSGSLLRGRLEGLVSDLGLDHFAYAMARPPRDCGAPGERAALSSLPQPLIERFLESGWLSLSLVLDRATRSNHPFFWGGERFRRAIARPQRRLYDEVRGFGLSHGLGIPVHCARGATGVFIVTAGSAGRVVRAVRGNRGRLYGAAHGIHQFMLDRHFGGRDGSGLKLSVRETECLLWISEGKRTKDIAAVLGISVATVNRHVGNAVRKLGCANRGHAACKALRLGLI